MKHGSKALGVIAATLLGATQVEAGLTAVNAPKSTREQSVEQILEHVYGGAEATRVDDSMDELFAGSILSTRAIARFGSHTQKFGLNQDGYSNLFDVSGWGYNVTGSTGALGGSSFEFGRWGVGEKFYSVSHNNSDHHDHLVTYRLNGGDTYVLFWEDLSGSKSDFDYNDLVVELKTASVPLPAAALVGVSTMVGGLLLTRLRRRRA